MMRTPRIRILSTCALALAVCLPAFGQDSAGEIGAAAAPNLPEAAAANQSPKEIETLYRQLESAKEDFQTGLEKILAGEQSDGIRISSSARERLGVAARRCSEMTGCEVSRFLEAFDQLLESQRLALAEVSSDDRLEMPLPGGVERDDASSPLAAVMPEFGRTESMFRGRDLGEIIDLNGPVKAALDDWLTWMRPLLMEAYENYQFLRNKMAPVYEEAGLPEALLFAIIATETGGRVHAYSRAGAAGPLQFMRSTGRRYGLTVEDGFDMRLDPVAAAKASVAYLNDQLADLNDSLEKTLAAYNGGENRVRRLHRRYRGVSFWDSKWYSALPRETREYVPRILAASWLFLHPGDYNLQFPDYRVETTELELEQDIALDELSICLGQDQGQGNGWFRVLRNLNPRLEPGERIKRGEKIEIPASLVPAYRQRCVEGEYLDLARELHDANYPDMLIYTVAEGDTLGRIAARFRCTSTREIGLINNLRPPRYLIRAGQQLKIPGCSGSQNP